MNVLDKNIILKKPGYIFIYTECGVMHWYLHIKTVVCDQ